MFKNVTTGTSLAIQWVRLHTSSAAGTFSPCWGTKIPHAKQYGKKKNVTAIISSHTTQKQVAGHNLLTLVEVHV